MALLIDTGPIYALLDRSDSRHNECRELLSHSDEPRVVTSPVLVEVEQLVTKRVHQGAFLPFLADVIAGAYVVVDLLPTDYVRIAELCARYQDAKLGLVDASIVAVAERLNERKIATLDHRHFRMVRPRHCEAFDLLP